MLQRRDTYVYLKGTYTVLTYNYNQCTYSYFKNVNIYGSFLLYTTLMYRYGTTIICYIEIYLIIPIYRWSSLACLFLLICLGYFVPLEKILLIWRLHHYRYRAAKDGVPLLLKLAPVVHLFSIFSRELHDIFCIVCSFTFHNLLNELHE